MFTEKDNKVQKITEILLIFISKFVGQPRKNLECDLLHFNRSEWLSLYFENRFSKTSFASFEWQIFAQFWRICSLDSWSSKTIDLLWLANSKLTSLNVHLNGIYVYVIVFTATTMWWVQSQANWYPQGFDSGWQ